MTVCIHSQVRHWPVFVSAAVEIAAAAAAVVVVHTLTILPQMEMEQQGPPPWSPPLPPEAHDNTVSSHKPPQQTV